jgi:hypothetical protein
MRTKNIPIRLIVSMLLAACNLPATTHYVSPESTNPTPPYTNWATAALTIQEAVDTAAPRDEIVVTNGVYQTGARAVYGTSNRVAVTKPVTVRSVNGPAMTHIVGSGPMGTAAMRCVYLANEAILAGFTLTNGATQTSGDRSTNQSGGGVWCEGLSALVSHCVLTGNSACEDGGGAYSGTLNNCAVSSNSAGIFGGGASYSTLNNCALTGNSGGLAGGGAMDGTLNNCALTGNSGGWMGGGALGGTLNNCTITGNRVISGSGGGVYGGVLNNCTVAGNSASYYGGGVCGSVGTITSLVRLSNCIVYENSASLGNPNYRDASLSYCCTTPLLTDGLCNITNAPAFVNTNGWSNLRLQTNSPCINAGNNAYASGVTDLDGNRRIAGATVDIGAYEFQGDGLSSFTAWLWQYGLPIDGSADATDPDHDNLNNWQEWVCKTCPTNSQSALLLLSPILVGTNLRVTWLSAVGVNYYLERSTNLTSPFTPLASNIVGQAGFTSYEDTDRAGEGPFFYRVGVTCRPDFN